MQSQDSIDISEMELKEPGAIGFTFDALGWKILLSVLLLSVVLGLIYIIINYRKNRYRREALHQIHNFDSTQSLFYCTQILGVLKSVAISVYGRERVAELNGSLWYGFLDRTSADDRWSEMTETLNEMILKEVSLDKKSEDKLVRTSKFWIKKHDTSKF